MVEHRVVHCCSMLFLVFSLGSFPVKAYEDAPPIALTEFVKPGEAQSVHHRIEEVRLEGNFLNFTIDSEFGIYRVPSLALLHLRVEEIKILGEAVVQFSRDKDALEELPGQLRVSADSAIEIITNPLGTATDAAGQLARNINDTLSGVPVDMQIEKQYGYDRNSDLDPSILMHKRNIASQWRLDVYSTNPKVQEFLNTVARARSSGRISSGMPPLMTSSRSDKKAVDQDLEIRLSSLFKGKSRNELYEINKELLRQMQIPVDLRNRFLQMRTYTPTQQTRICHYLANLDSVLNRAAFLEVAVQAQSEQMTSAMQESIMMLTYYDAHYGGIRKLYFGDLLQAVTEDNRIVSFIPVDVTYWSKGAEKIFNGVLERVRASGYSGWELISTGKLTEEARSQLTTREFVLREKFLD